mgnify:CR=1 FL=1
MLTEQEKRKRKVRQNIILFIIIYIVFSFYVIHAGAVFNGYDRLINHIDSFDKDIAEHIKTGPFFMAELPELKLWIFSSVFFWAVAAYILLDLQKKYMFGKEHGSSKWADKKDIEKLKDKNDSKNIILTKTEMISTNTRKTRKNLNVFVAGGAGTGKSRFVVKPNLLQANTSYVITDPKGELLRDTGQSFIQAGFKLKVFNLIEMGYSNCYSPFAYIRSENDVLKVINALIKNTNPKGFNGGNDPFWEKSETALLQALFFYIWYEIVPEEQNMKTVMQLLRYAEVKEEDESYVSDLDIIFNELKKEKPDHIANRQYTIFKQGAGKTAKSILISVGVRLAAFNIDAVANLTSKDELELDKIGDEKTVLFVVIPDSDTTFNFLAAMMYSQLFDSLYYTADFKNTGRLKNHVRCILDEFANIGYIPEFENRISTMRSREISCTIILQNLAQLETMYKDSWKTIVGNCDSFLFLGSKELSTLEYVSKQLGKETIDTRNINYGKGKQGSTSYNYGIHGRELMTPDEVGRMPDDDCILLIRGLFPFYSKKYVLENHPRYKYLYDYSEKNYFDYRDAKKYYQLKQSEDARIKVLDRYSMKDFELEFEQLENLYKSLNNRDVEPVSAPASALANIKIIEDLYEEEFLNEEDQINYNNGGIK